MLRAQKQQTATNNMVNHDMFVYSLMETSKMEFNINTRRNATHWDKTIFMTYFSYIGQKTQRVEISV